MDKQKTGQLIKDARTKKGYTQTELGDLLGVTNKAVSRWENGDSFPDVGVIENLANTLDITIEEIIVGTKNQMTTEAALEELLKALKIQRSQRIRTLLRGFVCVIYGVIIILAVYGIYGPNFSGFYTDFNIVIMAAMIIFMMFSSKENPITGISSRTDTTKLSVSLISGVYSTLMLGWCILKIMHDVMPFGMDPMKVGPFIDNQLLVVFLLNLLIFASDIFRGLRDRASFSATSYAALVVLNLELFYQTMLLELTTDIDSLFMDIFIKYTAVIYFILLVVIVIRLIVHGKKEEKIDNAMTVNNSL